MSLEGPERELFSTVDETRAKTALGSTFLVGGVPYVATIVEPGYGEIWTVRGVPKERWPGPTK